MASEELVEKVARLLGDSALWKHDTETYGQYDRRRARAVLAVVEAEQGKPQITDDRGEAEAMYPFDGGDPDTIIALRSAYRAGVAREGRAALEGDVLAAPMRAAGVEFGDGDPS